ncbi:enhancer of polycomb-like protein 1 [Euphorbia lathyris]|uniref:enhancer of polycomb-like protein 1 n=1 Tax=Euphorbia lathyris TaxID=212925 RepID=UPI003313B201
MSRLSLRPRAVDINRKLSILKSLKDFEDDETPTCTRKPQQHVPSKRNVESEIIPTPEFVAVGTYERNYPRTFGQANSYLRARGARAGVGAAGEFVEYDLDNEDEDWLKEFNKERKNLLAERLETFLFRLELFDHRARERAGALIIPQTPPIPVVLKIDGAIAAIQPQVQSFVFQSVYTYWKEKRERWGKPILRRLQPPPPATDTDLKNVFRPRPRPGERGIYTRTRMMQRRENHNNVQKFEKLREVRRNLDEAKTILEAVIKREEKKREVMENEFGIQRMQLMNYKHELLQDKMEMDPVEPVLLFTKPLDPEKLAGAGIIAPVPVDSSSNTQRFRGKIGRGGRIIFDRLKLCPDTDIDTETDMDIDTVEHKLHNISLN